MNKTLENELKAEDNINELCGFKNIATTLLRNYEIETLGDLVEMNLEEIAEEDIKPLVKAFSEFDDGVLSKEDKEYLRDVDDNDEMLAYIKETFEYIQEQIYSEEEDHEECEEEDSADCENCEEESCEGCEYYEENEDSSDCENCEEESCEGCEYYKEDEEAVEKSNFKEGLKNSYEIGSAKKLLGLNHIVNIFIEDNESTKWNQKHKDRILKNSEEALEFIKKEAIRYGVKGIKFENIFANEGEVLLYSGVIPGCDSDSDDDFSKEIVEQALEMSGEDYIDEVKKSYNVDNVVFMFHVNKPGRCYCSAAMVDFDGFEVCVMYRTSEEDWDEDGEFDLELSSTYAHELIHAYGAWDFYDVGDTTTLDEESLKLINTDFASEIMMTSENDINTQFISDITAYQIGWIYEVDKKYKKLLS